LTLRAIAGQRVPGTIHFAARFLTTAMHPLSASRSSKQAQEASMLKSLLCGAALAGLLAATSVAQTTSPGASPGATTPPAKSAPPAAAKPEPAKVNALVGRDVRNVTNETIGEVNNIVVDPDGKVQQVIVSVGGFLGVGSKHVALAWNQIRMDATGGAIMVDMTKEQLKSAPEVAVRRSEPPTPAAGGGSGAGPARTTPAPKSQ
jgi:sporulation protein YlmC with PRC-barrel domain